MTELSVVSFATFYGSVWQHPYWLWLCIGCSALFVLFGQREGDRTLRRYCLALVVLSALDAWLTADHVLGMGKLPASLAGWLPLAFVIAGDWRVFFLVEGERAEGVRFGVRSAVSALGWALIVPITSGLAQKVFPADWPQPRTLFITYELMFFALATYLRLNRARGWTAGLLGFSQVYYGFWITADALILLGAAEPGFAVRALANGAYYGGVIFYAWLVGAKEPRLRASP